MGINLSFSRGRGGGSRSKSQSPVVNMYVHTISRFALIACIRSTYVDVFRGQKMSCYIQRCLLLLSPAIVIQRIGVLLTIDEFLLSSIIWTRTKRFAGRACKGDEHEQHVTLGFQQRLFNQERAFSAPPVHSASTVRVNGSEHIYMYVEQKPPRRHVAQIHRPPPPRPTFSFFQNSNSIYSC